jgi:hypothetical protein
VFLLNKWYLDLVTPDGAVVVCYSARLRWGATRLRVASILLDVPGATPEEAVTVRRVERPVIDREGLRWSSETLDVHGEWRRLRPAIRETLLRDGIGAVRWSCRVPLATAEIQWGHRRFAGLGYVESLGMTVSPTRLPFRTLRWGRHLSPEHSLVWIDWSGDVSGRWVWLDEVRQRGATLGQDETIHLPEGRHLDLRDSREIRDQLVFPAIGALLPGIASRVAGSLGTLREHKRVSRSALYQDERSLDSGWTVHEVVTW